MEVSCHIIPILPVCVKDIEYSELCLHEVQLLISASESKHYRGVSVGWVWSVEGRENW